MNITRFMNGKLEIRQTIENFDYPYTQTGTRREITPIRCCFSSYSISSIFNFPFRFSHLFLILKKSVIHFQLLLNLAVMNLFFFFLIP